jgi:hypothetical protein
MQNEDSGSVTYGRLRGRNISRDSSRMVFTDPGEPGVPDHIWMFTSGLKALAEAIGLPCDCQDRPEMYRHHDSEVDDIGSPRVAGYHKLPARKGKVACAKYKAFDVDDTRRARAICANCGAYKECHLPLDRWWWVREIPDPDEAA